MLSNLKLKQYSLTLSDTMNNMPQDYEKYEFTDSNVLFILRHGIVNQCF